MHVFYRSPLAVSPLLRLCQSVAHSTSTGWRMFFLASLLLLLGATYPAAATDVDIVKERVRANLLTDASATDADAAKWINLIDVSGYAQGQFSDIKYDDQYKTDWQPLNHLRRLHRMALLYYKPSSRYYQSADVLTKFQHGVTYYMDLFDAGKILSTNWYFNRIGQQLEMGQALLVMQPAAPASVTLRGSNLLQGTINTTSADKCGQNSCTAQNLTWVSDVVIYKGCLTNTASQLALGFSNIQSTLSLQNGDGIQYDLSFHQHEVQLYSGGYGINFLEDISFWMTVAKGTAYAFSAASVDTFSQFLLDGDAWMVRGAVFDYSTRGREISRKQPTNLPPDNALSLASDRMATLGTAQQANLTALANAVRAGSTTATGNRHFWRSDYTAHQRPGYFTSLRMFSTRLVGSENVNDENLLGYYMAHGATFIYRQGNEYHNIFPTWDWAHIPGVTSRHVTPKPLKEMYNYAYTNYPTGSTPFVGGVSDGTNGLSYLTYDENGVQARKAWFFFDEGFFAFGAGITSTSGDPIHTTLNQCLLNGPVIVGQGATSATVDPGLVSYPSGSRWVHHNEVGYVFPTSTNVGLKIGSQSGRWSAINGSYDPNTTYDATTLDVFNLWVDHGTNPSEATYQYIVLPNKTAAQTSDFASSAPIQTLSNTTSQQAVYCKTQKLAGLVFSVAGKQTLPAGYSITVDQPCLMLVQEQTGQLKISISNPLNAALAVNVDVTSPTNVVTRTLFSLPGGNDGGKTLTKVVAASFLDSIALATTIGTEGPSTWSIYPNPVSSATHVTVAYQADQASKANVTLYDAVGRQTFQAPFNLKVGDNQLTLPISRLTSGQYTLRIQTENDGHVQYKTALLIID